MGDKCEAWQCIKEKELLKTTVEIKFQEQRIIYTLMGSTFEGLFDVGRRITKDVVICSSESWATLRSIICSLEL